MKCVAIGVCVMAVAFGTMASVTRGDSYYLGQVVLTQSGYSSGVGGEFTATISPPDSPVPQVVTDLGNANHITINAAGDIRLATQGSNVSLSIPPSQFTFQTFCIQAGNNDVVFYPGNSYNGILTTQPIPGSDAPALAPAAAVLYDDFWLGQLPNYDYPNNQPGLSRQASAGALQAAIWTAEGDDATIADAEGQAGITGNTTAINQATAWLNEAEYYVSHGGIAPTNVEILELYGTDPGSSTPHVAQNQLVVTNAIGGLPLQPLPVPLPATAGVGFLMLVGFGALAGLRKRVGRGPRIAE